MRRRVVVACSSLTFCGLGQRERIREVLDDVARRERAVGGMRVGQERLHPVIAQHEAVRGALGQRLEQDLWIDGAGGARHGERLGEGDDATTMLFISLTACPAPTGPQWA